MSENTTDLDHIISKLSGEGGLGQLLLNDDVKAKLVEYLHKETNLSKVVIKFTLGIIYKLANNCIKQTNKQINSYFQNKISKYSALIKALNWYFDELEKKLNAKNFFKDIKDGKLNADNLDKLDTSLQAVGTIYRQNEEIKGLIAEALSQLREIIDTLETMKVKLPINLAPTTHSDTKLQRFHYNSAFIPFVGREKEQEILKKFVDSEPPFSWLSLCEQGGAGKSRLAYHFCHHGVDAFWDKGFFKVNPNTNTDDFNQWQPSLDTFIVIDYAGNHIQKVKTLLSNFEQKAQVTHCKIRVLLLERNLKTPNNWYEVLTSGSGNSLKTFEYSDPFNLNALSDEENYNIAEQFAPSKLPSSQDFSAKLEKIDTKKRAFFAAMLADSIEQGTSSNNKEALFDEYYRRSYEHFWKKIDNKYYYFLGLASIGANINPQMLNGYPQVELFPIINEINQQHIKALEINYNNESYTNTAVDLMAEYFVLKHILSDDYTIIKTSNGNTWLNYIWQDLPEYAASFTARCLFDFPELAKSLLNLTESDNLTTVANILVYLTAITGDTNLEQTTTHYRTLRDLASKHKQSEIYIAQAKALFNLITYYGETNLEQATKHYQTLDNLASKHKQSEIYIEQAKALFNLVNYYGETNLEQATKHYQTLDNLASEHKQSEIYILQAKALVNLVNDYGETNLEQATTHYRTLRDLASKHKQSEIYIAQAKALFNLVNYYGETNLEQATTHYRTLRDLASKHKQSEIYIAQAKALVNLVNYYGETNLEQATTHYRTLRDLASKHKQSEIYIEQAKALVNLVNYYGETNLEQATTHYRTLRDLASKHKQSEIYIAQAKALFNLITYYGETNLEQATKHYQTLDNLASKHKQSEIYIAQAKALFNLITYYGETNLEQATKHYQTLDNLASKHKQSEIYIEQAKALVNLVNDYGETNLEQATTHYRTLRDLASKHKQSEIYIEQAKALVNLVNYYGETDLDQATKSILGALIEQYWQYLSDGKVPISSELFEVLARLSYLLIKKYSSNEQDKNNFEQKINDMNNAERFQYCFDKAHLISQQLQQQEVL